MVGQSDHDYLIAQQAAMLLITANDNADADQVYRLALGKLREPYAREIRLDYLEYLERYLNRGKEKEGESDPVGVVRAGGTPAIWGGWRRRWSGGCNCTRTRAGRCGGTRRR